MSGEHGRDALTAARAATRIRPFVGLYDVWVGTHGSDMISATLFISELDPRESLEEFWATAKKIER